MDTRPHLDGNKQLNDAILYSGNGFAEWFKITHQGNAIMGAGNNFSIRNNWVIDRVYGIFPEFGENGLSRTTSSPVSRTPPCGHERLY